MYVCGGDIALLEVRQQGMESENGDSINEWRVCANHGPFSSLEDRTGRAAPEVIQLWGLVSYVGLLSLRLVFRED